ncbi:MAG: amino acid adenylation domain-containing protein, partial [Acidobacteria bacterium]|nr:amino acid adenylation domain-containing protein [Acidobacteriota bacterium]
EGLIGFFVNTLVLRTDLSGNPGFRQLLAQVRQTALAAYEHQDLPFEKLVEAMEPARDMSLTPLIQAVFVLQNAGEVELRIAGLETECLRVEPRSAKFDLTLSLEEKPHGGIEGYFNYSTDLFEASTVRRMAAHFQTLLAAALAEPERPVRTLNLLPEAERRQLLVEWNDTRRKYPRVSVHELFRRQARERADAVALVAGSRRVTYAELDSDSDRVAAALRRSGLPAGGRVGLFVERSPEMVAGFLGVLKAGGAYVPLDPAYPIERLRFMAADAGLHLVLTQRRLRDAARALGCALSVLEELPPAGAPCGPAVADDPKVSPDSPIYVLYTSGSTGRPKGVVVPHCGVVRLLFGVNYARFGPDEAFLQAITPAFDLSTFEIWGALLHGGRCVLYLNRHPTASELGRLLRDERVTTAMLPSSLFNTIVDQAPATLAPLRQILVGGEAVSAEHVRRAHGALPETEIVNAYGPTETSVMACSYRIPLPVAPEATSIPIGGPIANTTVYVLDPHQQLAPVGVAGELYIGGDGVALEYLNLPQLTAERFLPDPFAAQPGARLYRTGDLVRWRPDGNLEFLGRLDSQVKLRGFRIELGEIEAVLNQHPAVRAAAVLLREDIPGSPRLVAYVTGPASQPAEAELRAHLKRLLPEYMLPSCFVFLDRMPLTASGKLDRHALPPPEVRGSEAAGVTRAYDPLELRLLSIWRQVLGTPEVGPGDDFFTLGGHSLLGLSLLVRIEQAFGVRLSVPSLFEAPTVEQQAALLRGGRETHATRRVYVLEPGAGEQPFFLMDAGPLFRELARSLKTGQPVLGLWLGDCGNLPVPFRIEDLAAIAAGILREVQPSGPYVLGGWCASGLLAYEVAQQLQAAGETVDLLVLFDVFNPARWRALGAAGRARVRLRARGTKLGYHLARLFRMDSKAVLAYLDERFEEMRVQFHQRRSLLAYRAALRAGQPVAGALRDLEQVIYLAAQRYTPKPYSGRVAFFRGAERPVVEEWDPAAGWRELWTDDVRLDDIPGGHVTMFHPPGVNMMAERLRHLLGGCRERSGPAMPG